MTDKEFFELIPDNEAARLFLIKVRWKGVPICPYCKFHITYSIEKGKRLKCANDECYKKFSAITGSIFESCNMPIQQILYIAYIIINNNATTSCELSRKSGATQKSTWLMQQKILNKLDDNITENDFEVNIRNLLLHTEHLRYHDLIINKN